MRLGGVLRWMRDRTPRAIGRLACGLCNLLDPHGRRAYSQEGEDLLLLRLFEGQEAGFYVDVGAHHPVRFSNTCLFHRMGWRGINIDADPEAMRLFARERPADINVCVGISDAAGMLTYHVFNESALNTFDERLAQEREALPNCRLLRKAQVPVERLEAVLSRCLPAGQQIDFLSVDAEGFDVQVLDSNDWSRFRPRCVLAEALKTSLASVPDSAVFQRLSAAGYHLYAKTVNTLLFRDSDRRWD